MIEYLWNADDLKKTEHSDSLNIQFSIINSQFQLVLVVSVQGFKGSAPPPAKRTAGQIEKETPARQMSN